MPKVTDIDPNLKQQKIHDTESDLMTILQLPLYIPPSISTNSTNQIMSSSSLLLSL
ncbi:7471_t:CDS:2 [Ambispora gerdemannii]|uniref:7471_t:CDS:1 n=1 Tax=Ambispora gerdemannii TaxID=144530 RepID=A0A9N9CJU6_9GLOM|nr:7471_t:CDS:2 [Ambispora gerdemannii]